jgi:hypothetical protein
MAPRELELTPHFSLDSCPMLHVPPTLFSCVDRCAVSVSISLLQLNDEFKALVKGHALQRLMKPVGYMK